MAFNLRNRIAKIQARKAQTINYPTFDKMLEPDFNWTSFMIENNQPSRELEAVISRTKSINSMY